jgi:hypothetical protein
MSINRRKAVGLLAAVGAGSGAVLAQISSVPPQTPDRTPPQERSPLQERTPDDELQIARAQRLRDAQRIAMVKLPPFTEPAFRFRP